MVFISNKNITIAEIADIVGVSKATVSNYINEKFSSMSPDVRFRIQAAIEETGYQPNERKRNFQEKVMNVSDKKNIAFVLPDITDAFYSSLVKSVSNTCNENHCHLILANTDNNVLTEKNLIESLIGEVDGFIISTTGNNNNFLLGLKDKTPVVLVDRAVPEAPYDFVSSNNQEAMEDLINYLLALGYQSFAIFTEELLPQMARTKRVSSYIKFFAKNELSNKHTIHIVNVYDDRSMMREIMSLSSEVKYNKTAFIATNGRTMLQLLSVVQAFEFHANPNLGICGYDDFEWAGKIKEGITTVSQPTKEIGEKAVKRLLQRICTKEDVPPQDILLKSKIEIRASV